MPVTKTVVISCAGVGSRLGLGQTKALIEIEGKSLIRWQLEQMDSVDDIRIVVGYQANDLITEVCQVRDDVVFVYNHKYYETKTGTSLYLGSRFANDYILGIDGDMIIHPDDMKLCLTMQEEFVGYGTVSSNDTVYVQTDCNGNVEKFSRESGEFEWTGPVCLKRDSICFTTENVFNQIEPYLPMKGLKLRAQDIDTYEDYEKAIAFVKSW